MKVLILGVTGMLGSAVLSEFEDFKGEVIASSRSGAVSDLPKSVTQKAFDARKDVFADVFNMLDSGDYIINCIGIIKSEIDENSQESKKIATSINATFPSELARFGELHGCRVIQIATDCAFSGRVGKYSESSPHDAEDHYGKTKSSGEISSEAFMNVRVSVIGPEKRGHKSLYDWVALQPREASITGYTNHIWNGIPAKHFGKVCRAIIESNLFKPGIHHLAPRDEVTKAQLVRLIANHASRTDLTISDGFSNESINRTLVTNDPIFNSQLWAAAGYTPDPSIAQLFAEM